MLPLLLAIATAIPITVEPQIFTPAEMCEDVMYELQQAVDFEIITSDQATDVYIRCLVNYS